MICAHCRRTDAPRGPCHGCGSTIHATRSRQMTEDLESIHLNVAANVNNFDKVMNDRMRAIMAGKGLLNQVVLGPGDDYKHGHAVSALSLPASK